MDGDMSDKEPVTWQEAESWDEVIPDGGVSARKWEFRAWSQEIRRGCPKCGTGHEKNWQLRWLREVEEIGGDEALKVICVRCGWHFFMETQEAHEARIKKGHSTLPRR